MAGIPGAPGLFAELLALCARRGLRPNIVGEVERMMTNLNLVAAGAGISVVPASMQGAHPHAIVYRAAARAGATATVVELVQEIAAAEGDSRARPRKARRPG